MEIGGPYPFRAAVAYQSMQSARQPNLTRTSPVQAPSVVAPVRTSAPAQVSAPNAIDRLVAGRVPGGMDFELASTSPVRQPSAFQLYTRDADRLEAATGVERGRIIDLKG